MLGQILEPDAVLPELSLKPHERGSVPADSRGVAGEDRTDVLTYGVLSGLVNAWDDLCTKIQNFFN